MKTRDSMSGYWYEEPEEIAERKRKFIIVMNDLGLSYTQTVSYLIDKGLDDYMVEMAEEKKLDPFECAMVEEGQRIQHEEALFAQMKRIYDSKGVDKFVEWYDNIEGSDPELLNRFLEKETWRNPEKSREAKTVGFLRDFLADGNPSDVDSVRLAAEAVGIIPKGDRAEWKIVCAIASRHGFTTDQKGYWALPPLQA